MKIEIDISISFEVQPKNKTKKAFLELTLTNNLINFVFKQDEQDLYLACTNITYGE